MKLCTQCGLEKPYDEFNRKSESPDGRQPWCKPCFKAVLHERYRYRKYRISVDRYNEILDSQNGGCAICGSADKDLEIDHDHGCCETTPACGRCVRGLLCRSCNVRIGRMENGRSTWEVPFLRYLERYLEVAA